MESSSRSIWDWIFSITLIYIYLFFGLFIIYKEFFFKLKLVRSVLTYFWSFSKKTAFLELKMLGKPLPLFKEVIFFI